MNNKKRLFRTRTAAEWIEEAKIQPRPACLLGDLWLEGELAVMLGEHGSGKTVLAMQVAESIARGKEVLGFTPDSATDTQDSGDDGGGSGDQPSTRAQRVLYFDLELSARQFEARYSVDPAPGDEFLDFHYEFSHLFQRSEIDPCLDRPDDGKRLEDFILDGIETEIVESGAKVVIIDSIDGFNGRVMRSRDIAYVMNRIKRLKAKFGLSILVLAHLTHRNPTTPIAADRLIATRTLVSFADSVFAIGQCRWDERHRYIKHLRSKSTDIVFDAEYVPAFFLSKVGSLGSFLSFNFDGFRREETMLDAYLNKTRLKRADEVKELAAEGRGQREIAVYLDMSLGSVNRSLHMWSPFDDRPAKIADTVEQANETGTGDDDMFSDDWDDDIDDHADLAGAAKIETGLEPKTKIEESAEEKDISLGIHSPCVVSGATSRWSEYDFDPTVVLDDKDIVCNPGHPMYGLKRGTDANGREIFVAREHASDGHPQIWYRYTNIPGRLTRRENLYGPGTGSHGCHVTEVTHTYEPPELREA
jgi:hypothetical protein